MKKKKQRIHSKLKFQKIENEYPLSYQATAEMWRNSLGHGARSWQDDITDCSFLSDQRHDYCQYGTAGGNLIEPGLGTSFINLI